MACSARTKPSGVPSGLCWRTMASQAERVACTQASSGPYSSRTWSLMRSIWALRSSVFLLLKYVNRKPERSRQAAGAERRRRELAAVSGGWPVAAHRLRVQFHGPLAH